MARPKCEPCVRACVRVSGGTCAVVRVCVRVCVCGVILLTSSPFGNVNDVGCGGARSSASCSRTAQSVSGWIPLAPIHRRAGEYRSASPHPYLPHVAPVQSSSRLWMHSYVSPLLCVRGVRGFHVCRVPHGVRYSYMGACDGPHAFYTSYSLAQREVTTWKRRARGGGKGQVQRRAYRLAADQSFFDVVDRKLAKRKCPIGTLLHPPPYPVVGGTPDTH